MGTIRTPGVFHDEVFLSFVVVGDADNCHRMAFTLPTDTMMLAYGSFRLYQQRIHGDIIEPIMHPVVRQVEVYFLVIG